MEQFRTQPEILPDLPASGETTSAEEAEESTPGLEIGYRALRREKEEILKAVAEGEEFFTEDKILSLFTPEQQAIILERKNGSAVSLSLFELVNRGRQTYVTFNHERYSGNASDTVGASLSRRL